MKPAVRLAGRLHLEPVEYEYVAHRDGPRAEIENSTRMEGESAMLLAGDIGGTKAHLAVFPGEGAPLEWITDAVLPSAEFPTLEALVKEFLTRTALPVRRASFGVPGPVVAGRAATTNLPWVMDEARIRDALGLDSVWLLNDLEAAAYAVPYLAPDALHTLSTGEAVPGGPVALIAPGTGLGEAFLTWVDGRPLAHASEGGHTDFAPVDELQIGLLRFLQARFGHASYERVCSGRGIPNIYDYLREIDHAPETPEVARALAAAADPTPIIVGAAMAPAPCPLAVATLELFASVLGAEAGNLALKTLATGGVYLGGGMPPRVLPVLERGGLLQAFRAKGRFSGLLERIPVHVITRPGSAVLGAAHYALRETPGEPGG